MTASNIYVANTSGAAEIDGVEYQFNVGVTHLRKGHPLLEACPTYFDLVGGAEAEPEVEQATAAPGERRGDK